MRRFVILILAAGVGACTYPNSRVDQSAENGLLSFPSAPADARVMLDGQDVGLASAFPGAHALSVKPGTHRVVLTRAGAVVLDKKYYVGAGAMLAVQND